MDFCRISIEFQTNRVGFLAVERGLQLRDSGMTGREKVSNVNGRYWVSPTISYLVSSACKSNGHLPSKSIKQTSQPPITQITSTIVSSLLHFISFHQKKSSKSVKIRVLIQLNSFRLKWVWLIRLFNCFYCWIEFDFNAN